MYLEKTNLMNCPLPFNPTPPDGPIRATILIHVQGSSGTLVLDSPNPNLSPRTVRAELKTETTPQWYVGAPRGSRFINTLAFPGVWDFSNEIVMGQTVLITINNLNPPVPTGLLKNFTFRYDLARDNNQFLIQYQNSFLTFASDNYFFLTTDMSQAVAFSFANISTIV